MLWKTRHTSVESQFIVLKYTTFSPNHLSTIWTHMSWSDHTKLNRLSLSLSPQNGSWHNSARKPSLDGDKKKEKKNLLSDEAIKLVGEGNQKRGILQKKRFGRFCERLNALGKSLFGFCLLFIGEKRMELRDCQTGARRNILRHFPHRPPELFGFEMRLIYFFCTDKT